MPPQYIWLPALSGLVVQLLNLVEMLRLDAASRPDLRDWVYWVPFAAGPILGGFAGFLSFEHGANFTYQLGAHVGASAPLILKGLANTVPRTNRGT